MSFVIPLNKKAPREDMTPPPFKSAATPKGPRQTSKIRKSMLDCVKSMLTEAALGSVDEKAAELFPTYKALQREAMSKGDFIESMTGHFHKELSLVTRAVSSNLHNIDDAAGVPFWAKFLADSKSDEQMVTIVTSVLTPAFKAVLRAMYPFIDLDHDDFVTDDDLRLPLGALVCQLAAMGDVRPPAIKEHMEKFDPYGNHSIWTSHNKWLLEVGNLMRPRAIDMADASNLVFLFGLCAAGANDSSRPWEAQIMELAFAALDADNSGTLDGNEIKGIALDLWSVVKEVTHQMFTQVREIFVPSKLFTDALTTANGKADDSGAELEAKLLGPFEGGAAVSTADLLAAYRAYKTVYRTEKATVAALQGACKDTIAPGPLVLLLIHASILDDEDQLKPGRAALKQWQAQCNPVFAALLEFYDNFGTMIKMGGFLSIDRKRFGETLKPLLLKELDKGFSNLKAKAAGLHPSDPYTPVVLSVIDDAKHLMRSSAVDAFVDLLFSIFDVSNEGSFKVRQLTNFITFLKPDSSTEERLDAMLAFFDRDGDGKMNAADIYAFVDKVTDKLFGLLAVMKDETSKLVEGVLERACDHSWPALCKYVGLPSAAKKGINMDQISKLWQSRAYSTDAIIAEAYSTAPGIATPEAPAENQPSSKTLRQISPEDKERYEEIFLTLDTQDGLASGAAVTPVLKSSGLALDQLRQIWTLSDIDRDGRLKCDEFAVAMHLARELASGAMVGLPETHQADAPTVKGEPAAEGAPEDEAPADEAVAPLADSLPTLPVAPSSTGAKLSGPSLKEKVSAIKAELGIDEENQGRAIKQANEMLGITASGNFVSQVNELYTALDLREAPP